MADNAAAPSLELTPELAERVLALLVADDARDACAAACVCTAWARAAAVPAVWHNLRFASPHPTRAAQLTDARLVSLVARARGALQSLDVTGCVALTDEGIAAALAPLTTLRRVKLRRAQPPASKYEEPRHETTWEGGTFDWTPDDASDDERARLAELPRPPKFDAALLGDTKLTARGIAAALAASVPLEELCVDGFVQHYERYNDGQALEDLATLLPLVGGDAARLDVVLCGSEPYWAFETRSAGEEGERKLTWQVNVDNVGALDRCHKLRTRLEAACAVSCQGEGCEASYCAHVRSDISTCECMQQMCSDCQEDCKAYEYG